MAPILLAAIEDYARLTAGMQQLAAADDWDAWLKLEPERDAAFAKMAPLLQPELLNDQTRAILKEALQRNQQMERDVQARHAELADLLKSLRKQQKVSKTYR